MADDPRQVPLVSWAASVRARRRRHGDRGGAGGVVDEAWVALQDRCPRGRVHGVAAVYRTHLGVLRWRHELTLSGTCIVPDAP